MCCFGDEFVDSIQLNMTSIGPPKSVKKHITKNGGLRDTRASQKVKVFGSSCILGKRANVTDPEAQLGCKET